MIFRHLFLIIVYITYLIYANELLKLNILPKVFNILLIVLITVFYFYAIILDLPR